MSDPTVMLREDPVLAKMSEKGSLAARVVSIGSPVGMPVPDVLSDKGSFTPTSRFREDGRPVGSGGGNCILFTP